MFTKKICLAVRDLRTLLDPGHMAYSIGQCRPKKEPHHMPLELSITNEEKVKVTVTPVTAAGKPALLDGPPVWAVVSGDATVELTDNPLAVFLVSGDLPGDSAFLVTADADLGAGVVTITDTVTLHVLGAMAASLGLTAEPPVPK